MPSTNPYLNRLPVNHPSEFYGREQEVSWLLERILHVQPQCCAITGLRRIGKSSLLNFLAHPEGARERYAPFFQSAGQRLLLVYADLSLLSPGAVDLADAANDVAATMMLGHILRALDRETRGQLPAELWRQIKAIRASSDRSWHGNLEALVDALEVLEDEDCRVVFLLDELDVLETLPSRLAHALRALVMEHNIGYVTASLHPLHELLLEGRTSPLYNLFSTRSLALLEREEARALLVEPAHRVGVTWSGELTEDLLDVAGGHPDLVKMAASHLWDLLQERGSKPPVEEIVEALRVDANGLFTSLWDHLTEKERWVVASLASGRRGQVEPPATRRLHQRALLIDTEGEPELFSPLFGEWVRAQSDSPGQMDDLRLEGRWIVVDGDRRQLTPTEAKLADILLKRRGQTVSREELQQEIWDHVKPDSKALDTTVQRLRDKIEEDRANPRWLVTVRGEGYALK
ncbi:MAG: winged helix-turn-helix domain-containing protein [Chloroflexota bacterium]|nr:winged helix-turn-helix domain-containing protein [Chloroflexota bacterium]